MCLKIDGVFPFLQRYIKQSVLNMFISYTVIALVCSSSGFAEVNLSEVNLKFMILAVSDGHRELVNYFCLY